MRLYVVRHGIAHDLGENGVRDDALRALTPLGMERTRLAAQGVLSMGSPPSIIGSSPLVRAWQTAEIFREQLGVTSPVTRCDFMAPGTNLQCLFEWLGGQDPADAMLVGHMPDVVWITQACLPSDDRFSMNFKKAAVACVVFNTEPGIGAGRLEWFCQPRELRAKAMVSNGYMESCQ